VVVPEGDALSAPGPGAPGPHGAFTRADVVLGSLEDLDDAVWAACADATSAARADATGTGVAGGATPAG